MKVVDFTAYRNKRLVTVKANGKEHKIDIFKVMAMRRSPIDKHTEDFIRDEINDIDSQIEYGLQHGLTFSHPEGIFGPGDDDDAA